MDNTISIETIWYRRSQYDYQSGLADQKINGIYSNALEIEYNMFSKIMAGGGELLYYTYESTFSKCASISSKYIIYLFNRIRNFSFSFFFSSSFGTGLIPANAVGPESIVHLTIIWVYWSEWASYLSTAAKGKEGAAGGKEPFKV